MKTEIKHVISSIDQLIEALDDAADTIANQELENDRLREQLDKLMSQKPLEPPMSLFGKF